MSHVNPLGMPIDLLSIFFSGGFLCEDRKGIRNEIPPFSAEGDRTVPALVTFPAPFTFGAWSTFEAL